MMRAHAVLDSAAGLTPFGHLAWGYRDRAEFLSRAAEFIGDGLRHNQYIAYAAEGTREALRSELAEMPGIGAHLDSGAVNAIPAEEYFVYLPGTDVIDADGAVAKYLAGVEQAIANGYAGVRAVSDVTPVARTSEQRDALARLEYLIDQQVAVLPVSALCAYDLSELGAAAEELICLHPFVSKGAVTFRLYADPGADVDFALTGEIDAAANKLFDTTLQRVWPLQSGHTVHIDAQDLTFISHQQLFTLEERARKQDRNVKLWTNQPVINRLVDVLGLTRVQAQLR
ncbi:MAG: MEDS domain-containing protein [Mycobacterium sp.]